MGTYAIKARFESTRTPSEVMSWLDRSGGIAGWWSDTVSGSASAVGDAFRLSFPTTEAPFDLEVSELSDTVAEWRVAESPPWWAGTTIRFELTPTDGGGTSVLFTHSGFEPDDPILEIITPAWVHFVDNLVAVAGSGQPNPAVVN